MSANDNCKTKRKDGYEPIYDEAKKMTNAEKYKEVFGFEPDKGNCPSNDCGTCPLHDCDCRPLKAAVDWWDSEYKEKADVTNTEK